MNTETGREMLERCTFLIPEADIRKYVREALEKTPAEFYTAPSSSTGKYHPPENNGQGGLVRHTVKTVLFGHDLAERTMPEQKGVVLAACILHDSQKCVGDDGKWGKYAQDHGFRAYEFLKQFDLLAGPKERIGESVRLHMYDLTEPADEFALAVSPERPQWAKLVQYADQSAATMWGSFIPGFNTRALLEAGRELPKNYDSLLQEQKDVVIADQIDKLFNLQNLEKAISMLWKSRV